MGQAAVAGRSVLVELSCLAGIERSRHVTLERQVAERLRAAVSNGHLPAGGRLPPTRALALDLGIARNTLALAYEQLVAEGYLEARKGAGTYVAKSARRAPTPIAATPKTFQPLPAPTPSVVAAPGLGLVSFSACRPAMMPFPVREWRRAFARAASRPPGSDYGDPAGDTMLREAIAGYLRPARSLNVASDNVVITAGASQAVALLAKLLIRPGDAAAIENPGYPLARHALMAAGARIVPIQVDADGLIVDALPCGSSAPKVVYVTPSHQYPLGARLALFRRIALLAWAEQHDAVIIEDDYDGEFRYDAAPLPPLAALDDTGRVAYVGTFSKTLSPTLRLGFVVASSAITAELIKIKVSYDYHAPELTQQALATLIRDGVFGRHVARMRRVYAERRAVLQEELAPLQGVADLRGLSAGLVTAQPPSPPKTLPPSMG